MRMWSLPTEVRSGAGVGPAEGWVGLQLEAGGGENTSRFQRLLDPAVASG